MIGQMDFPLVIRDSAMPENLDAASAASAMSEEEFRAFYERTARPLWAYLSRITGDRQQADDLLQEAYYRFFRAGARHESESHRRNSLFHIATNLVRDAARRGKHRESVSLDDRQSSPVTPISDAPVPARQAEIRTDLQRAMTKLEPMQRELLWLAYAQGASHEEIAAVLGVRAISVRTLLFRAKKKLAAFLGGTAGEVQEAAR